MPKKAKHIERPWLAEAMAKHPGGRKAITTALGISHNQLSEYVTCRKLPRPDRLQALCNLLGLDIKQFYSQSA